MNQEHLAGIIVGGIVVGLLIVVGLPVILSVRNSARHRELEHAERMKALELGRPWPIDSSPSGTTTEEHVSSESKGVKIGIWVPLGALGIAFVATSSSATQGHPADIAIWVSSACVGVAGVICGTILALHAPLALPAPTPRVPAKPSLEDDALDIVSRRG